MNTAKSFPPTPEDALIAAKSDAMRILSLRPHGTEELKKKLLQKHASREVEAAVEALRSRGLLNDEKFAKLFAESRAISRPAGRKRLEDELRRKGVAKDAITKAMSGLEDYDERAEARKLALARLDRMKGVPGPKKKARLYGFLQRRGFRGDAVYSVLNEIFKDFEGS